MTNFNEAAHPRTTSGQFATKELSEPTGVVLDASDIHLNERGIDDHYGCPVLKGAQCGQHGTTAGDHPGDMEVRGCFEVSGNVESVVDERDAQFWTVYSMDRDGTWLALDDYDSRSAAREGLQKAKRLTPNDIESVQAMVESLDPLDHIAIEQTAKGALAHLPPARRAVLEAALNPAGGPVQWNGSAHAQLRNVLHAGLVDATQDVPTSVRMKDLDAQVHDARVTLTNERVARDMKLGGTDKSVEKAAENARQAENALHRADELRERASLRRVLAGKPTIYDMWEIQERHDKARDVARRRVNEADLARSSAIAHPENAFNRDAADAATQREAEAVAERARQKDALNGANAAWQAIRDRENAS